MNKPTLFFALLALGAFAPAAVHAQGQTVTGRVVAADSGEPLPGTTILVRGTTTGTTTNLEGIYSIAVPADTSVLVFSFVGYQTQAVVVAGRRTIDVEMAVDDALLGDVVVVGYGTQRERDVTTAISSVSADEIDRQVVAGFEQALQGQVAGVQVTAPSGQPGAGINIRVRGSNSVSLTNSPLYVIDGVPILPNYGAQQLSIGNQRVNPLASLNPDDIQSIDILKDGAAAAIYGSRAANGVVVVTTRRGRAGRPQIDLEVSAGVQTPPGFLDVLDGQQFARLLNDQLAAAGAAPAYNPDTVTVNTDWQKLIFRDSAPIQNYQVGISGGDAQTRYYLSGAYFNQDGIIRNSGFDRYSFRLNLDNTSMARLALGANVNLSRSNYNGSVRSELALNNGGVILGALSQIPTIPVYAADGRYALNQFNNTDNPLGQLLETSNLATADALIGNVFADYTLLSNLNFRTSLGLDYRTQNENQFITRELPGTQNANPSDRGSARTGQDQQTIWLLDGTLTYRPRLAERLNVTLLGGASVQESDRFTSSAGTFGFPSNAVTNLYAGTQISGTPSSYREQWGLISGFARANFEWADRYLATVSLRADGSSRFAKGNRFGYFPALSLGWRVSEEGFFPRNGWVSDLKLRASAAANGNQEVYVYDRFSSYGTGFNYPGAGELAGGIGPNGIGNEDLRWETTYQYDLGLDAGLLGDRVQFTADAYLKRTNDLLTSVPLPPNTGFGSVIQNVGTIENRGLEFAVNTRQASGGADGQGFLWTTSANLALNRSEVIDLGTLRDNEGNVSDREIVSGYAIARPGKPLGAFYGYVVEGLFQSEAEIADAPTQNNAAPGDIRFADLNGDGQINGDDQTIIGNPSPDFTAGLTNTFAWRGLELTVFFQGSFGNDIYNANRQLLEGFSAPLNASTAALDRWTPTNTDTSVPRAVQGDPNGNARFSTRFLEDGTYVRLKNLTLAYTLPTGMMGVGGAVRRVRIYLTGQNLLTFTGYSGYDPEVSADPFSALGFGRDFGVYPQARTFTFGLNVGL